MVLFYHRIAATQVNPWTTSPRVFERQMAWLRRNFDLVSLEEAQRRIASGENRRPAVSITFDDGYADNCAMALPLLLDLKIPVTYFVASQNVLDGQPFPHDVECGAPLAPNTPDEIRTRPTPASRSAATRGIMPTSDRSAIRRCSTRKWSPPGKIWKS